MNERLKAFLREIERLRAEVYALFLRLPDFQDPEVLEASKKLDDALNEYEQVLREKAEEE